MPANVDFKRALKVFANCGASLSSLGSPLSQLRLNFSLRLTTTQQYNRSSESESADFDLSSNGADDFAIDTECVFQLQELLFSDSAESGKSVCLTGKLHLLLLLQENADSLVRTRNGLVQLLSFLLDLTKSQQQPQHLTAQAMVCCCSLMISRDLLRDEHQLCSKLISYLLDIVGSVNGIHNMLLRFRALQCLIALEDAYPCLLSKKLDYFYEYCTSEKTYLSEFYYSLFSLLLVHVFDSSMKDTGSWSDDRLNSRVESLPAMSLSSIQPLLGRHSLAPVPQSQMSELSPSPPSSLSSNSPELCRAIGQLIGALDAGRLSPRAFFAVCRSVGRLLDAVGLGGRGLRTAFYRRLPVWDVTVLSALAGLRHQFGLAALGCSDEHGCDRLALSMQRVACSPLFATPLRLLMCHCLANYPHLRLGRSGPDGETFPEPASRQLVGALFPGVFDPVDLRVLKVRLLSLRFAPRDSSDEASACLMGTLVSLSRPAQKSGGRGRHAVAFFASLYAVFARHHASVLGDDIRQMLISMINANLAFAEHLLDFLDSVTQDFPDSDLPYQAYSELCDWVAINSAENAADRQSLGRYMTILNRAAMYSRIPPQPIVDCLAQLASINSDQYNSPPATSIEDSNLWLCGHRILDVSRSVFRTHWHRLQTDAGLLANLCGVLAHWAGPGDFDLYVDIDVRSRAQLYYSLASYMPTQKLASIVFESSTAVGVDSAAQKNFVITDQSGAMSHRTRTSLAVAAPTASQAMPEMRLLAEPPVELNLLTEQSGLDCELTNSDAETVLIVPVRLTCRRTSELLNESDLLAVDLTFSTHPDTADLSDSTPAGLEAASEDDLAGEASRIATVDSVHLPRLRLPTPSDQSASESLVEVNIGLRVACHRPLPFRLAIRLDCTSGIECRPLTAQLSSIRLGLADLLRPLLRTPVESGVLSNGCWCSLDLPGASFIRCPPGSAVSAGRLERFRLSVANQQANSQANELANATANELANATANELANTTANELANATANECWHYGFEMAPNCQLRLSIKSLPTLDLLTFRVIEANGESSSLSRDAWQLLVRFDRYLKSLFGAAEEAVVKF
ncbi:hypothetical protein BOX15_Mlig001251g4 [Macrostomum lignano]|uniref:AP5B1 middle domain-containing protein n=1 Tax=Macrostomum lignano TaxID=282301 RepID=A0A267GXA0_9PLAT|nr:hypothetical protein BOX15_Mlig001251g4 [Macrostomum lignano]